MACTQEDRDRIEKLKEYIEEAEASLLEAQKSIQLKRSQNGKDSVEVQDIDKQVKTILSILERWKREKEELEKKCNSIDDSSECKVFRSYRYGY